MRFSFFFFLVQLMARKCITASQTPLSHRTDVKINHFAPTIKNLGFSLLKFRMPLTCWFFPHSFLYFFFVFSLWIRLIIFIETLTNRRKQYEKQQQNQPITKKKKNCVFFSLVEIKEKMPNTFFFLICLFVHLLWFPLSILIAYYCFSVFVASYVRRYLKKKIIRNLNKTKRTKLLLQTQFLAFHLFFFFLTV